MSTEQQATTPCFWRDPALPFVETREALDGRLLCYAKHSHACFSIGTITQGRSTYFNEKAREQVGAGTLVLMNPGDVHACNPIDGQPWSYRMFYIDSEWLGDLQHQLGFSQNPQLQPFSAILSRDPELFNGLNQLYDLLNAASVDQLRKECALIDYFSTLQQRLAPTSASVREDNPRIRLAAEFIRAHCTQALKLDAICSAAELSPSYLIRSFRQHYGMTPHAYLLNCRVQVAQAGLKRGEPIAEVALDAGFSDQAHLQRTFKQLLAATPGQYRRA